MSSSSEQTASEAETYEVVIYKIQHRTNPDDHPFYVGCTKDFKQRMSKHKSRCNNPKAQGHKIKLYNYIRANGGWESFEMVELDVKYVENKQEKDEIENKFINSLGAELNGNRPGEFRRQGGERQYNLNHYRKRGQTKIHCSCGGKTDKKNKARHEKSQKHKRYESSIVNQPTIEKAGTATQYIYNNCTFNNANPQENKI